MIKEYPSNKLLQIGKEFHLKLKLSLKVQKLDLMEVDKEYLRIHQELRPFKTNNMLV